MGHEQHVIQVTNHFKDPDDCFITLFSFFSPVKSFFFLVETQQGTVAQIQKSNEMMAQAAFQKEFQCRAIVRDPLPPLPFVECMSACTETSAKPFQTV